MDKWNKSDYQTTDYSINEHPEEKRFEYYFSLYIKHQDQLQTVFNIVTTIGLGWLATECALLGIGKKLPKWVNPAICWWGFLNILLELIGIICFSKKIKEEKESIIFLFNSLYPDKDNRIYLNFFSMPRFIIKCSIILIMIECLAFLFLALKSTSNCFTCFDVSICL